jgi:hypothetical protein
MTDLQRNTRTLVVCFMVAIGGLVPLRFMAEGQSVPAGTAILGESTEQQVIAPVVNEEVKIEAPYDKVESQTETCIEKTEAQTVIDALSQRIKEGGLSEEETAKMYQTMGQIETEECK